MIGNKLGPYELIEEIGRGGMATVYKAYQPNARRSVAVKVIHRSIAADSKALKRFEHEAQLIGGELEHPHILPVYDVNLANDPPYIVMRYLPTGTLKEILERGQLPYHEVAFLLGQIASALDFAHRKGVIHRDIKPSNIMVDAEGNAYLTDFGIARWVEGAGEGLTGTGMAIGTPGYMAPEQGMGQQIDHHADIYALGVMLFEMLTGKMPFSAETPMGVILKHINDPVPQAALANPDLPPAVDKVIQRAMAKPPEDRFDTATDMARALSAALGPTEDATPRRLQAVAAETIAELEQARQEQQHTYTPQPGGGAPPSRPSVPSTPSMPAFTPPAAQTAVQGGAVRGAFIGAGAVIIVAILAVGAFVLLSSRTNNDGAATATALSAMQTATQFAAIHVAFNGTATASHQTSTANATPTAIAFETTGTNTATPLTPSPSFTATHVQPSLTFTATPRGNLNPEPTKPTPPTATFTATLLPPTLTATATHVPPTATFTTTPLPPTLTFTPTHIPPTATFTATPVPPTLTFTPTHVPPTATFTATPLPPTLTFTPLPPTVQPASAVPPTVPPAVAGVPTVPPVGPPTVGPAAPRPLGSMPYLNNFETPGALTGWDYDPNAWRLQADSGNVSLVGTGGQKAPAVVLAKNSPEWMNPQAQNLLVSMRMNLDNPASGGRVIVRYTENGGYYAFEMLPGLVAVKRGQPGRGVDRGSERLMSQLSNAPIRAGNWYQVQIWTDTSRVYVYIDHSLVLSPEDTGQTLAGGAVLLQTLNANFRVRFDDLKIQRPWPASQHFRGSDFPNTWARSNPTGAKMGTDSKGNGFVEVTTGDVSPNNPPVPDMLMACRLWSLQGGLDIHMRESGAGSLYFQFTAGNMILNQVDNTGKATPIHSFAPFYGRAGFFDFIVETIGNQIRVYKGDDTFIQSLDNMPPPGNIRFTAARPEDQFRIGDCLFAETSASGPEDAQWAFTKIHEVEARPYQTLLTDWYDRFDDKFRTKDWWEGGLNAPGDFKVDPKDPEHKNYLEMTYQEGASWRMFRYVKEFYVFGLGQDKATFFDSSDIYLRVNMRLPKPGTGWAAARTSASLGGGTLNGYRIEVTRDNANNYTVTTRGYSTGSQPIYFQGPLPPRADGGNPDWITLLIITYQDKVAFFANGRYVGSASSISVLNGTIALGVEKDSVADFADLQLRDVSPETR